MRVKLSERAERMSNRESHCYNLPHFRRVSVPRDYAQSRGDEKGSSAALSAARARRIVHRGFVVGEQFQTPMGKPVYSTRQA